MRAALTWSIGRGDAETAMRLIAALDRFWSIRGYYAEARRWIDLALAADRGVPSPIRARTLSAAGIFDCMQDYGQAVTVWEEALALFKQEDDTQRVGNTLSNLGVAAHSNGDYDRATAFLRKRWRSTAHAVIASVSV